MDWQCPPLSDPVRKVTFSCPKLEENLGNSLRSGNLIELVGEAGSAKTQFCLHLAVQTAISGHTVFYIVTERAFPTKRLDQILESNQISPDILDHIIIKNVWESVSRYFIFLPASTRSVPPGIHFALLLLLLLVVLLGRPLIKLGTISADS
jgi:RecA/RadA recombinase